MNQKLEDQLQLALATSEEDRARTEDLNVGFDRETKRWELIVKYHGNLSGLEELGVTVERLLAGYAVLTVPEGLVERIAEIPEIEYVEKPKRFFYDAVGPTEDSCVIQVTGRDPFLTGEGVLVAVLDSGIDYRLPEFRNADGSTRIRYLWDQTLRPESGARSTGNGMGENGAGVGGQGETGAGESGAGGGGQEGTGSEEAEPDLPERVEPKPDPSKKRKQKGACRLRDLRREWSLRRSRSTGRWQKMTHTVNIAFCRRWTPADMVPPWQASPREEADRIRGWLPERIFSS